MTSFIEALLWHRLLWASCGLGSKALCYLIIWLVVYKCVNFSVMVSFDTYEDHHHHHHHQGGCWVIESRGTSRAARQPSTSNLAVLGEAALLEPGRADPSLVTDKQQTTQFWQPDTYTNTHSLCERPSHIGTATQEPKTVREQTCEYNLSFLSPSISNTTTHMPVNGAEARVPSGTFSSPTHGVHHFLSNSPFPIVNTHLCTIRRASSRFIHTDAETHKHTNTSCRVFAHARYSTYKRTHLLRPNCHLNPSSLCTLLAQTAALIWATRCLDSVLHYETIKTTLIQFFFLLFGKLLLTKSLFISECIKQLQEPSCKRIYGDKAAYRGCYWIFHYCA